MRDLAWFYHRGKTSSPPSFSQRSIAFRFAASDTTLAAPHRGLSEVGFASRKVEFHFRIAG